MPNLNLRIFAVDIHQFGHTYSPSTYDVPCRVWTCCLRKPTLISLHRLPFNIVLYMFEFPATATTTKPCVFFIFVLTQIGWNCAQAESSEVYHYSPFIASFNQKWILTIAFLYLFNFVYFMLFLRINGRYRCRKRFINRNHTHTHTWVNIYIL